jgi:hypothetical protein
MEMAYKRRIHQMIKCEQFEYDYQLSHFCNDNHITKNNIIAILWNPDLLFSYRLFYETND